MNTDFLAYMVGYMQKDARGVTGILGVLKQTADVLDKQAAGDSLPQGKLLDMMLAGGTQAGRGAAVYEATGEKAPFGLRHPYLKGGLSTTIPAGVGALGGGVLGAAVGGIGTKGDDQAKQQGAARGGIIGAGAGGLIGALAGSIMFILSQIHLVKDTKHLQDKINTAMARKALQRN